MKFDVVGIDSPCMDLAVNVQHFPKANGGEQIKELSWQGGGKVASGMVAAARLGAKCAIMGNGRIKSCADQKLCCTKHDGRRRYFTDESFGT